MVTIKQLPEDFVVREIFEKQAPREGWKSGEEKNGSYVWFNLTKRNYDLFRCLKILSRRLGVSPKRFGYAGTKDKRGVTTQKISVWNVSIEKLKEVRLRDIELSNFEESQERINLGDLRGNEFEITVRDIEKNEMKKIEGNLEKIRKNGFINYFGEQRFGIRGDTHLVGREIIRNRLGEAVWLYLTNEGDKDEHIVEFRKRLKETKDVHQGLRECPRVLGNEITLLNHLAREANDYAGALRRLPKKMRMMLVHAYQSYLWNEIAKTSKEDVLPVIGFNTDVSKYKTAKQIEKILDGEGVRAGDFRIKSMPELSSEGTERQRMANAEGLDWAFADDDINEGKLKCTLKFALPKGAYATVLISEVLK